jgi:hypothetical protein
LTPTPLIPLTLVIACVGAASIAFGRGRSIRHSLILGIAVAVVCSLTLPPFLMGALMVLVGDADNPVWVIETMAVLGGMLAFVTALLAIPCGAVSGVVGRGIRIVVHQRLGPRWRSPVSITRGFVVIAASTLSFGLAGGAVGFALGRFTPGYYRALYPDGYLPRFDPLQVGLGLGITQGLTVGVLVGVAVLFAVALSGRPSKQAEPPELA